MKIIYFRISLPQIYEYCETLQVYLPTCMAYLFLISILQKCSFPLMIQRFFLFEKTNVKTRTIIDFLTIKIKKNFIKKTIIAFLTITFLWMFHIMDWY